MTLLPLAQADVTPPPLRQATAPLDQATPLRLPRGATVTVEGLATTSFDGTEFDAFRTFHGGSGSPGGLFEVEAAGLRIVREVADRHQYVLEATGTTGPACKAAAVASPCLAPRLRPLAQERLQTERDFAATLKGHMMVTTTLPPPPPRSRLAAKVALGFGGVLVVGLLVAVVFGVLAARRRSLLGQVLAAAKEARRAATGDPSLAILFPKIDDLVARGQSLDRARRVCAAKLSRVSRRAIEQRRAAWQLSGAAGAKEASEALGHEAAEASRLEQDFASSIAGLERIASALRALALRVRDERGVAARADLADPVDELTRELDVREAALAELEPDLRSKA
ncbi:MAG: hypothetical protein WCI05_00230 [Myxococcales bacterium]